MSEQLEQKIANYPECANIEKTETILKQMKNCVCQINKGEGKSGSGFFCYIPYENKELKVLITNYHVIDEKYIKEKKDINLRINNSIVTINILIENDRKIYLSPENENDLAIIEIINKDNLSENNFLRLDGKLLEENSKSYYESQNSIYTLQYPKEVCVSHGILKNINNNEIQHLCWTNEGSSGSPILSLETMKVIGVHRARKINLNFNLGIFLSNPINQIKNGKMKIIGEIKNNENISERIIEDGVYNIISKYCNNMAIDISCGSNENNANLQLYEFNNSKAQQFEVKYNYEHKYYTIKCLCSDKFLSVDCKNNYNIVQYEKNNKINQQWHIVFKNNSFEIISQINGYLMNIDGYEYNSGTNISCQQRSDKSNQQFQFEFPEEIEYFKKPLFSGIYSENSIVDGLKSIGEDSSPEYRAKIALKNGIQGYKSENNEKENLVMLNLLKNGKLKKP